MITNIIKLLLCIFTLCFFSFCKQNKQEKQEAYGDYSLLWKISSKGLTKPSYLFGTYHAENRFFLDSVPFLNQALKNISSDDSAALKISAEFLINCIKDPDTNIITPYEKEIAGYESQKLNIIEKNLYDKADNIGIAIFDEQILKGRNIAWMDQLPRLITEKPSFISVGVGHLPGEYGLINLLRKKGYKVEKVWNNKSNK